MDLGRSALRLFGLLAAVAVPPLAALAILFTYGRELVSSLGTGLTLLLVALVALGWAALVAMLSSRSLARDQREMLELAERGGAGRPSATPGGDETLSAAQRRLAGALDERNRQIAALAADVAATPITGTPTEAAVHVVGVARRVTGDATWQLAVLSSSDASLLPVGTYDDREAAAPGPLRELHAWAATSDQADSGAAAGVPLRSHPLVGPWGAFMAVDASAGEQLKAVLMAPWEGRSAPSPAETSLLSLLGQHAAVTIEHALLYARLRAQTDELNRMAAVQTDFLRGVSHDLQTPLTSIRALAVELSAAEGTGIEARIDLQTIAHQAERLRRMVAQLLAVSRLEVGALTPRQEVFRAAPLVRRTWEALRAGEHRFELEERGARHLVVADPDRLEQVLWALLDNAVKYSPTGSRVRVELQSIPVDGDRLESEISVHDEGPGMDDQTRARAFEQFFRADAARQAAPDGSGIGLYAARGLVEAMGGRIWIDGSSSGATLLIRLPAEAAESEEPELTSSAG